MKAVEELSPQVGTTAACHSLGVPRATLYGIVSRSHPSLRPRPGPSRRGR